MPSIKNTPALRQGCRSVNQLLYIQHFCHLVEDFGVIVVTVELVSVDTQSAVSHQLRVLKNSKLVKFRREGKTVYYSLADDHVTRILSQGMEHIEE